MTTEAMPRADASDADLVAGSLAGDRRAFGRIVARYQSLVCSLAYSATGSLSQSEDVAQETFVSAWKQLQNLREPAKLRSWLCGITRNRISDLLRSEGREPACAAGESLELIRATPSTEPSPHEHAISREEEAVLWQSVERIPEIYREPLILFYREHKSVESVATDLDLTADAVKQRLARGRKLLHEAVRSFVESALERTRPGEMFTLEVLGALPALTLSAKAATLGAMAAKGGVAAKVAASAGFLGAALGSLLVFSGNYAGYRMSLAAACSEEERGHIRSNYRRMLAFAAVFFAAFAALIFWALRHRQDHALSVGLLGSGLVVIYLLTLFAFITATFNKRRRYLAGVLAQADPKEARKPAWEYRSRLNLLGLPLVHICIGDRFALLKKPVKAWIAVGDCAVGGLFAFGGMAIAPLSIGGFAIGLLPFGGLAVGILAIGGTGLGVWTFGGLALGWQAFGGCATAWNAAVGGIALAHDFALGGIAHAAQANTEIAGRFAEGSWFLRSAQAASGYCIWLNLIWVIPMAVQWRIIARRGQSQRR